MTAKKRLLLPNANAITFGFARVRDPWEDVRNTWVIVTSESVNGKIPEDISSEDIEKVTSVLDLEYVQEGIYVKDGSSKAECEQVCAELEAAGIKRDDEMAKRFTAELEEF